MKKEIAKIDSINLSNVKINLSKGDKKLLSKESVSTRKELYIGMQGKSSDEQKKFRGWIRRELKRFVNQILGKDRSDAERLHSIEGFISFYKENWKITDFKIDNFSQSKNEVDLKDYLELLKYVSGTLEISEKPKKKEKSKNQKEEKTDVESVNPIEESI